MKKFLSLLTVLALGTTFVATVGCGNDTKTKETKKVETKTETKTPTENKTEHKTDEKKTETKPAEKK